MIAVQENDACLKNPNSSPLHAKTPGVEPCQQCSPEFGITVEKFEQKTVQTAHCAMAMFLFTQFNSIFKR